jgi:hypothetical protein
MGELRHNNSNRPSGVIQFIQLIVIFIIGVVIVQWYLEQSSQLNTLVEYQRRLTETVEGVVNALNNTRLRENKSQDVEFHDLLNDLSSKGLIVPEAFTLLKERSASFLRSDIRSLPSYEGEGRGAILIPDRPDAPIIVEPASEPRTGKDDL